MIIMSKQRLGLLGSVSVLAVMAAIAPSAFAQVVTTNPAVTAPPVGAPPTASSTGPDGSTTLSTVIVTGSTSRRTLLDTSVAVTAVTRADLDQRSPRSTADILDTVPGIFVEATAGPVSNNYSVRGLPGGSQQFIRLEEDGMPAIYGGLNDDEVFQYDLSIDHVEALEGGTSGILTENAAGASINFISRKLNFDQGGGIARVSGATYGDGRGDLWYSAPLPFLGPNVAFAVSGYYDSTPGVRSSPFRYDTYHFKGQLEKKFDDGGYVEVTYKRWDEHDPYYADQPYAYANGKVSGVPSLSTQSGNIIGSGFGNIVVPDSCAAGECTRTFSEKEGIHEQGNEYRIDIYKPITDSISLFGKARYTQTNWDFNGVFAGSGTGNGGLASAVTYLTNTSASPIQSLLQQGLQAFPTTTQFGIKNLTTGVVTPASNVAALNALNGNGLLQQTVLNRQFVKIRDWGSDFGAKWKTSGDNWTNNLTVGGMVYSQSLSNDQSGVSAVVNDVKNESNIYDIVALNSSNNVIGTLSNNGLISYGDWGNGISSSQTESESVYFNNEFTYANRLHIDFGLRYERERQDGYAGVSTTQAVPAGTPGVVTANTSAFNGFYTPSSGQETPLNYTVGVNYTILSNLSVYGRYADAYQTGGENAEAAEIKLYEAGATYAGYGVIGTVRGFRTLFNHQSFGGGVDPDNADLTQGFFANSDTNGVDVDLNYRPTFDLLRAFSVHGQLTYQKSTFNNVSTGVITVNGQNIASQVATFYDGKTPMVTPSLLYTITPSYDLPNHLGSVYARYKYVGSIFADNGNALALPGYGVLSLGGDVNLTRDLNLNVSVENVTNALGLTEGNPRQSFTQSVVGGYFYGRGIVGTNAQAQLTYKF
jgi:outer membrane receptor protein involved in Fe transport